MVTSAKYASELITHMSNFLARLTSRRNLLVIGCGLAGLVVNFAVADANRSTWDVDFNQYYTAGKLVGSGHLYDWDTVRRLELKTNSEAVPFGRAPVFAVVFRPLSALPYSSARALWLAVELLALAGFICFWPSPHRAWVTVGVCWSGPLAMCLAKGQDTVIFLFFVSLGISLLIRRRDFAGGLAFSACLAKPHLALLVPVLLIAQRRWSALLGGAVGIVLALAVSFGAEGRDWFSRMLALAKLPEFDPAGGHMPNLRGLLTFLGGGLSVEICFGVVIVAAIWFLSRSQPLPVMGALVLAGGLLLSHHAYFYDAVLLLPALFLPFEEPALEWMRNWALLLFTPAPYLLLLADLGLIAHIAISGYTVALAGVMCWRVPGTAGNGDSMLLRRPVTGKRFTSRFQRD
jgi:hypothetical protein